jgi:hypothetical protein
MDKETCCPEFEPTRWDGKLIEWKNKKFIKDRVFTIFYMPISFGEVMKKLDEMVREYGSTILDFLCLSDHTSMWNMDIYLAVDKEIPELENITISGKFFSKVYEGPYRYTGKWCKDFDAVARNRNMSIKKRYMWYTTCPKCAKKYGKNYVVIMGKTD